MSDREAGGPAADLLLIRHGRTAWHSPNRYTGRSDIDLDDTGRRQADELRGWAGDAGLTALVSSPMARTMATATPIAEVTGLAISSRDALREIDFGIAEGRTAEELAAIDPAAAAAFLADPVAGHWPGGDDPERRAREAVAALAQLASGHPGGRVAVITHSTLLRLMLCELLGVSLRHYRTALGRPSNTSISTVRWDGAGPPMLLSYNVSAPIRKATAP